MPRMKSMKKNRIAQRFGSGIRTTASGYAMKANPGPLWTTSLIGICIWLARKPSTGNSTKPANTDVSRFVMVTKTASLREKETEFEKSQKLANARI